MDATGRGREMRDKKNTRDGTEEDQRAVDRSLNKQFTEVVAKLRNIGSRQLADGSIWDVIEKCAADLESLAVAPVPEPVREVLVGVSRPKADSVAVAVRTTGEIEGLTKAIDIPFPTGGAVTWTKVPVHGAAPEQGECKRSIRDHSAELEKRYMAAWDEVNAGKRNKELIPVWTYYNEAVADVLKDLKKALQRAKSAEEDNLIAARQYAELSAQFDAAVTSEMKVRRERDTALQRAEDNEADNIRLIDEKCAMLIERDTVLSDAATAREEKTTLRASLRSIENHVFQLGNHRARYLRALKRMLRSWRAVKRNWVHTCGSVTTLEDELSTLHEQQGETQSNFARKVDEVSHLTHEHDTFRARVAELEDTIEGLDAAVQRSGTELGKFPWVRTNPCGHPIGLFEGTGIECAECHGLLDELWCPRCNIGLNLPCPKCGSQAVTSHKAGVYYCLGCDHEFCISVPSIIPTVTTTCGPPTLPADKGETTLGHTCDWGGCLRPVRSEDEWCDEHQAHVEQVARRHDKEDEISQTAGYFDVIAQQGKEARNEKRTAPPPPGLPMLVCCPKCEQCKTTDDDPEWKLWWTGYFCDCDLHGLAMKEHEWLRYCAENTRCRRCKELPVATQLTKDKFGCGECDDEWYTPTEWLDKQSVLTPMERLALEVADDNKEDEDAECRCICDDSERGPAPHDPCPVHAAVTPSTPTTTVQQRIDGMRHEALKAMQGEDSLLGTPCELLKWEALCVFAAEVNALLDKLETDALKGKRDERQGEE